MAGSNPFFAQLKEAAGQPTGTPVKHKAQKVPSAHLTLFKKAEKPIPHFIIKMYAAFQ